MALHSPGDEVTVVCADLVSLVDRTVGACARMDSGQVIGRLLPPFRAGGALVVRSPTLRSRIG